MIKLLQSLGGQGVYEQKASWQEVEQDLEIVHFLWDYFMTWERKKVIAK